MGEGEVIQTSRRDHNRDLKSKEEKIDGESTIESHDGGVGYRFGLPVVNHNSFD